jgi:arginine-tRNA-protein transferase
LISPSIPVIKTATSTDKIFSLVMEFIDQSFVCDQVTPKEIDALLAQGWRHFGAHFFRYSMGIHGGVIRSVIPLRVDLDRFSLSRSQKRVIAKNRDVKVVIRATSIDQAKEDLFYRHRRRFKSAVPDSIYDFLSLDPATTPCRNDEICVYGNDRLLAASFLDVGELSTSAVYAMFDPSESQRSLGIFTMLTAINYSREMQRRYYYPGYAYRGRSFYDYKKNFSGLEYFDWQTGWLPYNDENENLPAEHAEHAEEEQRESSI